MLRRAFLYLLAAVFTVGLTFATVELPHVVDDALQSVVATPSVDSHADEISRLKTELFISHFHLRSIGYTCFVLLILLVIAGFATRRTSLATVGAVGFMLPVFAQFAAVMFFLAGLGALNILWLPVLDISLELQRLGLIIRVPYDALMWLFRQVDVNGYWPVAYSFLGAGWLLFFLGTLGWLSARARKQAVAVAGIYRICRHPQYLGWVLWSYGVYLLLLRGLYPKRSWGIEASLPWLVSTLTVVGVAMMEELNMRKKFGEAYDAYRRSVPFLFPVPRFVSAIFALPCRLLFKKWLPDRKREVVAILGLYGVLLIGSSVLFYGDGVQSALGVMAPAREEARMQRLTARLLEEPSSRSRFFIGQRLAAFGEAAVDHLVPLLEGDDVELRALAADLLRTVRSPVAVPALVAALNDPVPSVRGNAVRALGVIGSPDCVQPIVALMRDAETWIQLAAIRALAQLRAEELLERAVETSRHPDVWTRISTVESVGILRSKDGLPLAVERVNDEEPSVRRSAVVALLLIGSTEAREALLRATRDADWEVRVYAAEALKRLRS